MSKGRIFIVSGPSGVGKGTIVAEAVKAAPALGLGTYLSISMTSRQIRENEVDGESYIFVSRDRFIEAIENDELLEFNEYNGNYYGTPAKQTFAELNKGNNVILEIDVNGGDKVIKKCPDAVRIFVMPPSTDELETRLRERGTENEEAIAGRLAEAAGEMARRGDYDYIIVNDVLGSAVDELLDIMKREQRKSAPVPRPIIRKGANTMEKEKTIDEVFSMCDSRYSLVTIVSKRAREITEDAIKRGDIIIEKPVNIVLKNLKCGRSTVVRGNSAANLYRDDDFEVSISLEPQRSGDSEETEAEDAE